ncbi:NAD(P)-dependent oxidoreductase [Macrococcus bovicus]|uniref:6-phosphogluconate dehydrogenase, decarboxylating n=1 Tax=Macrococcus bovicus TaxID=69968 RepID=A0A4V3BG49_9STAP|nr:NAD(P)-dependent oxidoreductase [Macrococcus bovicus]TDM15669.1 NAD(P)-dependent oxidoreductase [Macrococcus bovicus]
MKIGFIGTGVMGASMAGYLTGDLYVYNRTKHKARGLLDKGAIWCDSPAALVQEVDIVFTMLGYPDDVREMYLGETGLIANGKSGQIMIDCTTSSPELAARIAEEALEKGIAILDAPVSGGDIGAKNGTLSTMVGGDAAAFLTVEPLLQAFSSSVSYFGLAGSGQHTKMANQIAIASGMIGVAESLHYAKSAGLDVERVLETIAKGAAGSWSLSNLAPRMLSGDFKPGFYTHHFLKDMKIALQEAEKMEIKLPGLALAYSLYEALSDDEKMEDGTHTIIHYYENDKE